MKMIRTLALIAAAALSASPALAQGNASASLGMAASVPLTAYIELDRTTITFNSVLTNELRSGSHAIAPTPVTNQFGGNGNLVLSYSWQGGNLNGSGGNTLNPNNVEVAIDGGMFAAMSNSDASWQTFAKGNFTQKYNFRLRVSMQTPPDTYSGTLNFAVTAS